MTLRRSILVSLMAAAIVLSPAARSQACSTFCLDAAGGLVFGKNYDWDVGVGLVVVNKRGVVKRGLTADNPARWTSRFGSVTFNQYGREMPCGGINEAGLVVELMWLQETSYPPADERPSVENLQWIQYQLDRSSTVADVIASDADIRITDDDQAQVHFLVCDRSGACAAIEFVDGEMTVHTGEKMPVAVLTNDTYANSLDYLKMHVGFGGTAPVPASRRSLDRFVRAASGVEKYEKEETSDAVGYAFGILASVAQGPNTQWSIVYDVAGGRINFRTAGNPRIRTIDLGRLDYSCDTPVMVLDVNTVAGGDATDRLEPYTREANGSLVESAFRRTSFLSDTPADVLDYLIRFPETTRCEQP